MASSVVLYAIPGCARCADLVAAGLLGASNAYDILKEHQENHEFGPSLYREVNELAQARRESDGAQ